uniref:Uncharacterized protein n=1 Tax=Arundo donax TaxID=35708 RepID=A0A0A9EQM8_ARUDO
MLPPRWPIPALLHANLCGGRPSSALVNRRRLHLRFACCCSLVLLPSPSI